MKIHKYNKNWKLNTNYKSSFNIDYIYTYEYFIFKYNVRIVNYKDDLTYPITYFRIRILKGPKFLYYYADKYMGHKFFSFLCFKILKIFQYDLKESLTYKKLKNKYNYKIRISDLRKEKLNKIEKNS